MGLQCLLCICRREAIEKDLAQSGKKEKLGKQKEINLKKNEEEEMNS